MSTAQSSDQSASPLIFAAPYLLGIVAQLPLLVRYGADLSSRPHFGLFLIGILATIAIAAVQWPWGQSNIHRATIKSTLFAAAAVVAGVAGAILGEPWLAACSAVLLVASYTSATVNREGDHSIGYSALPLVAFIRPPLNWDLGINARLQEYAIELASRFLSIVSGLLVHTRTDSAFLFPGKDTFAYADTLLGIGSVYSLIFIAFVYVVINRRNVFQTVLLVLSCFLWTVVLNTVYLMLLPLLNYFLEMELVAGSVNHNLIRVLLFLGTALMVFSSGEFLNFAFGPVDPEIGRSYSFGRFITAVWNKLLAGRPFINETGQIVGLAPAKISKYSPTMPLRWGMAGLLLVAGVMSLISGSKFSSVSKDDVISLTAADMPEAIDDWAAAERNFTAQTFSGTTVHGYERETWTYRSPEMTAECSIAEPFNIWHELPRIYKMRGWKSKSRTVSSPTDATDPWKYVAADLTLATGENQRIMFCYFDAAGNPVEPPNSDSLVGQVSSAKLNVQAPLFQVALTNSHYNELTPESTDALTDLFLNFRQTARERILRGATAAVPDSAEVTGDSESVK